MPRRKKVNSNSGALSNDAPGVTESNPALVDEVLAEGVGVEIENQDAPSPQTFRERFQAKLTSMNEEGLSESGKWKRKQKAKAADAEAEFSTLVSSLFIILVTVWKAPDEIKPNDIEIDGISVRVSRILMRHIDISGRMTQDTLDVIGIIAIGTSWYSRVAPTIKQYNANKPKQIDNLRKEQPYPSDPMQQNGDERWITPIEQASPGMKNFLDRVANNEQEG